MHRWVSLGAFTGKQLKMLFPSVPYQLLNSLSLLSMYFISGVSPQTENQNLFGIMLPGEEEGGGGLVFLAESM